MEFSTDADKRDLFLVFGLDKKDSSKDSFHNANSMIKKVFGKKLNLMKISLILKIDFGEKKLSNLVIK